MSAYDYEQQKWVEGPNAAHIRRKQIEQELVILNGPRGSQYMIFLGRKAGELPTVIDALTKELSELEVAA